MQFTNVSKFELKQCQKLIFFIFKYKKQKKEEMFDQEDYYSDQQQNLTQSFKQLASSKVLVPSSGSDFNHLTGQGQTLIKIMKDRGFQINDNQMKKMKGRTLSKDKDQIKNKPKTGFFDGGTSATLEELLKALNKALSKADPQQASCILSYILEKKNLSPEDRNKFGIMKCKILFGLGAYKDCMEKAEDYLEKSLNRLSSAILSNYLAKSKAENGMVLGGYMDFLRAKSLLNELKDQAKKLLAEKSQKQILTQSQSMVFQAAQINFEETELDTFQRQLDHTQLQYNIKMTNYKNNSNLVHPYFPEFRHRQIKQVVCGDFHALFLVGGSLSQDENFQGSQVFGIGENTVGQINGRSTQQINKEPILINQLSGKNIIGIFAVKQSSLAYDDKGNIYEWGIKQDRNDKINITFTIGEQIQHLEKGYQHYALLTKSKKFFTWGNISYKGTPIYKQAKPQSQAQNIVNFSCGNNCIVATDDHGDIFGMGSNEVGQLGLVGEMHSKGFKKINSTQLGRIRRVICINDATFLISQDEELYILGQISYNKQPYQKPRQGEFQFEQPRIISLSGTVGNYYITNQIGQIYRWDVDSSVKFKIDRDHQKINQRFVSCFRGNVFRVRSMICPQMTKEPKSYENISFQMELYDKHGPYGNTDFAIPPKCQIFLSTYEINKDELLKTNKQFLEGFKFSKLENNILLNQIVESRLLSKKVKKNNSSQSWVFDLDIVSQQSGKFYFYVVMEEQLIYEKQLKIEVSEQQKELSQRNKVNKQMREQQRRKKAEMEKQKLLQEKLKRQAQEEERRRQTQKRAEQALKKHMREQEQQRIRLEQDRKARKELQTGGGYDLNKMKAKLDIKQETKAEIFQKSSELMKSQQSFLPNINVRPNSKKKMRMPVKTTLTGFESVKMEKTSAKLIQDFGSTGMVLKKNQSNKEKQPLKSSKGIQSLSKTGMGTKTSIIKRGLSRGKK